VCGHLSHRRGGRPTSTSARPGSCSAGATGRPKQRLIGVGAQFAHARQRAGQFAHDARPAHQAQRADLAFDEGVALFHHRDLAADASSSWRILSTGSG
jgi:hypothetical protein